MTSMLTIMNQSFPRSEIWKPFKSLFFPPIALSPKAVFSISYVSDAVFPSLKQNSQMRCSFKSAIRKSWISLNTHTHNNKQPLSSNAVGYGGKTQQTDWRDSDTMASNGRKLYYLPFSVLAVSPGTFRYAFVLHGTTTTIRSSIIKSLWTDQILHYIIFPIGLSLWSRGSFI